jgi:hypothetical protein
MHVKRTATTDSLTDLAEHCRKLIQPLVEGRSLGLAGRWNDRWSRDVGFREEMPADALAIDFTLGARITRRWR